MVGRANRFHGYNSLRRVYQRGQSLRGPLVSLRFASRGDDRSYRVAVVVSRKTSKSAVTRNRIRRRIYEIIRKSSQVPPSTDLVFTVFSERVADIDAAQLQIAVTDLLQKASNSPKKTI